MNYLAHAYLSPEDPLILMGNLWGDLLKPKDFEHLDDKIITGVIIHRSIDTFTDQHDKVDQLIELIRPFQGKYTPVVADVMMDFMLSRYWSTFHTASLDEFCKKIYRIVNKYLHMIPDRLHPRINRMMENHWLESCRDRQRMERTLSMLSQRASFANKITEAMVPYDLHEQKMDELFLEFFVQLKDHVNLQNEG